VLRGHRRGAHDHLGAVGTQQLHLLGGDLVRHREDAVVPAQGSHHGQAHARVPRRGFHDGATGQELSISLGGGDHGNGRAVLHAPARVQVLEFGQQMAGQVAPGVVQGQKRRLADQVEQAVGDLHGPAGVGRRKDFDAGRRHGGVIGDQHERDAGIMDVGCHGGSRRPGTEHCHQPGDPGAQLGQGRRRQCGLSQVDDALGPCRKPIRWLGRRHIYEYVYVSNRHCRGSSCHRRPRSRRPDGIVVTRSTRP